MTDARTNQLIEMKLEFVRPWKGTNTVTWSIQDDGKERRVTWAMQCPSVALMPRIFSLIVDMDKMIGTEFENGLATLKSIVEKA